MILSLPSRYRHIKRLGAGGFGVVEQYYDSFLERNVAVKYIEKEKNSEKTFCEVNYIKKVVSKHVVSMYDVLEDSNSVVLIQECLTGKELDQLKGNLNSSDLLSLGYQISKGMSDIHKQNICHRDIKLENMRFDEDGILKIFDFGISRNGTPHITLNGNATIAYAAPELFQLLDSPNVSITLAFDIYSFGVAFWELITGDLVNFNPHVNRNLQTPSFETLNLNFSYELCMMLNRSLATDPASRPSGDELANAFHKELQYNKHEAKFVYGNYVQTLDARNRVATIKIHNSTMNVTYTGDSFVVTSILGNIYCNNNMLRQNSVLPSACVLSFKDITPPAFISFSSSHPEIVL